jgi:hypothetical protein
MKPGIRIRADSQLADSYQGIGSTACGKTPVLGGAALQRCIKSFFSESALAAAVPEGTFSASCSAVP